jgi:hypothetical protein
VQGLILSTLLFESLRPFLGISLVLVAISLEGLCGGLAYVNAFHHVGRIADEADGLGEEAQRERERRGEVGDLRQVQEREWRIGVVGAADSWGIVVASLVSSKSMKPCLSWTNRSYGLFLPSGSGCHAVGAVAVPSSG